MIWQDKYLDDLLSRGEIEVSRLIPCIFNRFSLAITAGTATYTLPNGILCITYKGDPIYPEEQIGKELATPWYKPLNAGSQSKPYNYYRIGYGYSTIEFRPVPNESIAANDTNIYGSDIANRIIISCWKVADPTGSTYRIPTYIQRSLLKYYALEKAFRKEGKGQNLVAADYFRNKYEYWLNIFKVTQANISKCIRRRLSAGVSPIKLPPRPVLPAAYRNT